MPGFGDWMLGLGIWIFSEFWSLNFEIFPGAIPANPGKSRQIPVTTGKNRIFKNSRPIPDAPKGGMMEPAKDIFRQREGFTSNPKLRLSACVTSLKIASPDAAKYIKLVVLNGGQFLSPTPSNHSMLYMNLLRRWLAGSFLVALAGFLTACAGTRPQDQAGTPALADPKTYLAGVCRELTKSWPANRTIRIVCHGHSVPAGYAHTPSVHPFDAYPFLLHVGLNQRFPHAVVSIMVTAIGGENSEQGARRFRRDVLSLRPDVVTIDYALNDRAIGVARSEKAWRAMIEMALAAHCKIILLTPTGDLSAHLDDPNDPLNRQAELIRRLAREYHTGLVDSLAAFQDYIRQGGKLANLMAQVNHPNRQGHELVAAQLLKWFPVPE